MKLISNELYIIDFGRQQLKKMKISLFLRLCFKRNFNTDTAKDVLFKIVIYMQQSGNEANANENF